MAGPDRYRIPHDFGLGGVALGNQFTITTDAQADATLEAAWEAGVRYFDVAPYYGLGLAERRYGRFLHRKPTDSYVLSTKVGRLLKAARDHEGQRIFPHSPSPNIEIYDYSADRVRRSIEDSLQRMGVSSVDVVFVHDLSPDNAALPADWTELWPQAVEGAFPALCELRDEGVIRAWGMGVNSPEPILKCMQDSDPDLHLMASQYHLLDHHNAVEQVFPRLRERNNGVVIGTALGNGLLAGKAQYMYADDNAVIAPEVLDKRDRMREIARAHGSDLMNAAIQFAAAPDVVDAVAIGCGRPDEVIDDRLALGKAVAPGFWDDLRSEGLIHAEAAVPGR